MNASDSNTCDKCIIRIISTESYKHMMCINTIMYGVMSDSDRTQCPTLYGVVEPRQGK